MTRTEGILWLLIAGFAVWLAYIITSGLMAAL